jgi:hypothetical protein
MASTTAELGDVGLMWPIIATFDASSKSRSSISSKENRILDVETVNERTPSPTRKKGENGVTLIPQPSDNLLDPLVSLPFFSLNAVKAQLLISSIELACE